MEDKILQMYREGISGIKISKTTKTPLWTVYDILKKNKVKTRTPKESHTISGLIENYFDNIDTEAKAYFLGIICADGAIIKSKQSSSVIKIDLSYDDGMEIFPLLCDGLGLSCTRIKKYHCSSTYSNNGCTIARVVVPSDSLCRGLEKFGVIERKTFQTVMPKLDKEMTRHFIRGYIDGDGCITHSGTAGWTVKIAGTVDLLAGILDVFESRLGISKNRRFYQRHKDRENNIRTIEIGGRKQVSAIRDYLYKDSTIFLSRKRNRFNEV